MIWSFLTEFLVIFEINQLYTYIIKQIYMVRVAQNINIHIHFANITATKAGIFMTFKILAYKISKIL